VINALQVVSVQTELTLMEPSVFQNNSARALTMESGNPAKIAQFRLYLELWTAFSFTLHYAVE